MNENLTSSKHLGVLFTVLNFIREEIRKIILATNIVEPSLHYKYVVCLFKSKTVGRASKVIIYKTILRLFASYRPETWTKTRRDKKNGVKMREKIVRTRY